MDKTYTNVCDELVAWFHEIAECLGQGERPNEVSGPLGTHSITYNKDEDGHKYALINFSLPRFVYGEVAYGTFDVFNGFRIYIEDAKLLAQQTAASGGAHGVSS